MAESINLFNGYWSHRKTRRLIGLIGRGAAELPLRLWSYCNMHHASDGCLAGYSAQEIESIVEWWGKSGELVEALVKVGFLDELPTGGYASHNWQKRNPHAKVYHERAKAAAKARWEKKAGLSPPVMLEASTSNASALHCTGIESKTENGSVSVSRAGAGYFAFLIPDAKAIVDAYQREVGTAHPPAGARNAVLEILGNSEATKDELLAAIKAWAPACKRANADATKRMSAAKWFRDGCWRDFVGGDAVLNDPDAAAKARSDRMKADTERRRLEDAETLRQLQANPLPEGFSFSAEFERRQKEKRKAERS